MFSVLGVWFLFYVAKENFNNEALEGTEAKPIDYFKHIKFVSLVGAMVLTLLVIFAVTRGLDRGFEIIEISR